MAIVTILDTNAINSSGGNYGQSPTAVGGTRVIGPFVINYNDPDILAGKSLYTPTIGDVLLDVWVEIKEPWNGETPQLDIGTFKTLDGSPRVNALFNNYNNGSVPLNFIDDMLNEGVSVQNNNGVGTPSSVSCYSAVSTLRILPASFVYDEPIKVAVSTTGSPFGSDPGATQGIAHIYLVVATPNLM